MRRIPQIQATNIERSTKKLQSCHAEGALFATEASQRQRADPSLRSG